jgi:hypothetical protein
MLLSQSLELMSRQLRTVAGHANDDAQLAVTMQRAAQHVQAGLPTMWGGGHADTANRVLSTIADTASSVPSRVGHISDLCRHLSQRAATFAVDADQAERRLRFVEAELAEVLPIGAPEGPTEARRQTGQRRYQLLDELDEIKRLWRSTCNGVAADLAGTASALNAVAGTPPPQMPVPNGPAFAYAFTLAWASSTAIVDMAALPSAADRRAWWDSLSEEQRRVLVATRPDLFEGTGFAALGAAWKASLDSQGARELYLTRSLFKAGINPHEWQPELGVDANASIIQAVYAYYGDTYLANQDHLWWSGMAAMIGASFYGGFQDLSDIRGMTELFEQLAVAGGQIPGFPGDFSDIAAMSAEELAAELKFYETTLLMMQREIFYDMGAAHEAYLDGGVPMIERLYEIDEYDYGRRTTQAWRDIDEGRRTGNTDLIAKGNRQLLYREQWTVIRDDYELMADRPVTGGPMTYLMTLAGAPSVPGARTFADVFPVEIGADVGAGTPRRGLFGLVPLPHVSCEAGVVIGTPLPRVSVAAVESRWALIEQDTLPAWVEIARDHPDVATAVLSEPVEQRAGEYRMIHRIDDIVTSWQLDVDAGCSVGFG